MGLFVLYLVFILSASVLAAYWLLLFTRLLSKRAIPKQNGSSPPVSVVIAARNEADNLKANLPPVLTQKYPNFQVIAVDDHSSDETRQVLALLAGQYPHLKVITQESGKQGKKAALTAGIRAAAHDLVLLTDADCMPESSLWIRRMVDHCGENHVLLGYGPMIKNGTLFNAFARFETVMTAIQYFSWALAGRPYMGVGRNLMYRKDLFEQVGGFSTHLDLQSGDDDLFVQEAGKWGKVGICLDPDSFMFSEAKITWSAYFRQKTRHVTTSARYRRIHQVGLGAFSAAQMVFYPAGIILLILQPSLAIVTLVVSLVLLRWLVFARLAKKLDAQGLVPLFPLLDLLYSLYLWVLLIKMSLPGKIEWKS